MSTLRKRVELIRGSLEQFIVGRTLMMRIIIGKN